MLDHKDTSLPQEGKRDIGWNVFRQEVQLLTSLESTQSAAEGVKTAYITEVLQSEIHTKNYKT
jgi:hypothetical protein